MKKSIATTVELRQKNRRELLSLLIKEGETTRNNLRNLSGFSYTTIGNLLNDLSSEEFIIQKGVAESTGGRQAQVTKVNPEKAYFISMDISTSNFKWAIFSLDGQMRDSNHFDITDAISYKDNFIKLLEEIKKRSIDLDIYPKIVHTGVVITGYYNSSSDKITDSYDEDRMDSLNLKTTINHYFDTPVTIKNDAKTAAYNEVEKLDNPYESSLFYILVLKEGLGSAFLLNGKVYLGANGYAGEIYPITQITDGKEQTLGDLLNPERDKEKLGIALRQKITDKKFFEENNNLAAKEIYRKNVKAFAKGIFPVLCILNPSDIRIGGFYNGYGNDLPKDIITELKNIGETWQYTDLNIELAELSTYTLCNSIASQIINIWVESLW